jgi:transposase InsO family protein
MRVLVTTLVAGLMLSACATRPQAAHEGSLVGLKEFVVLHAGDPASSAKADVVFFKAVQAQVDRRVSEAGGIGAGVLGARYHMQLAIGTSPAEVGISTAAGSQVGVAPWRSAPTKLHFWNRRGPVRTATLSVLDLSTGKVVAWSSVRTSNADAVDIADRLVAALSAAKV